MLVWSSCHCRKLANFVAEVPARFPGLLHSGWATFVSKLHQLNFDYARVSVESLPRAPSACYIHGLV